MHLTTLQHSFVVTSSTSSNPVFFYPGQLLVHAVPCCPATVYTVLLWLYLLSAFGKLNTYIQIHTTSSATLFLLLKLRHLLFIAAMRRSCTENEIHSLLFFTQPSTKPNYSTLYRAVSDLFFASRTVFCAFIQLPYHQRACCAILKSNCIGCHVPAVLVFSVITLKWKVIFSRRNR